MDGKRARRIDPALDHPKIPAAPSAPARTHLLSEGWAAALGLGWPLTLMAMLALQPPADNPAAAPPVLDAVVQGVFFLGLVATSILAGARHKGAAPVAVLTGMVTVAMVVSCPVSGHHQLATWWFAELAVVVAMLAVSVVGLRRVSRQ